MKIKFAAATVAVIAAVILGLPGDSAAQTGGQPIPGVDIIIHKQPGGSAVKAKTDKNGKVVFANLKAGKYLLSVKWPQTRAPINTSRSNIKKPQTSKRDPGNVDIVEVPISLGKDQPEPVEIEITKNGGEIIGTVTRAENDGIPPTNDLESAIMISKPPKAGSVVLYKGHKGTVTLVKRRLTITWENGFVTDIFTDMKDQSLTSYRTAPPKKGSDGVLTYELVPVPVPDTKIPPK